MLDGPEIGLVWLCESHIFAGIVRYTFRPFFIVFSPTYPTFPLSQSVSAKIQSTQRRSKIPDKSLDTTHLMDLIASSGRSTVPEGLRSSSVISRPLVFSTKQVSLFPRYF